MDETRPIQPTRELDYTLEDPVFEEPFDVYKSANAWWISEKAGNNRNNQVSKSHGLQVLILRYARDVQKIDTHKLYKINH